MDVSGLSHKIAGVELRELNINWNLPETVMHFAYVLENGETAGRITVKLPEAYHAQDTVDALKQKLESAIVSRIFNKESIEEF